MAWSGAVNALSASMKNSVRPEWFPTFRVQAMRKRARRIWALAAVPSIAVSGLAPAVGAVAGTTAISAAIVSMSAQPAKASLPGSVLILSTSVNGGSASVEAQQASALGLSVTVASASTWDGMGWDDQVAVSGVLGDHHRRSVHQQYLRWHGAGRCLVDGGHLGSGRDGERSGAGDGSGARRWDSPDQGRHRVCRMIGHGLVCFAEL